MRPFDYEKLAERTWDAEIVSYISKIHEYKGKQELFLRRKSSTANAATRTRRAQPSAPNATAT